MKCKNKYLGEITEIILGGTPNTKNEDYWNGDIPWISVTDFSETKRVYETEKTITESGLNNSNTKLLNKGDIIISARGTVGKVVVCGKPMAFNQSCYALRSKNKKELDQDFYFYLINYKVNHLKQKAIGGVFDTIIKSTLENLDVKLPPLKKQHKIASILSAYDDLIENNLRRIKLLEEAARLIYKEWFVRLRFPGHEHIRVVDGVPDGWELKKIADVVKLNYGKALKKDDRIDGEYPVFGSGGIVGYHEKPLVKGPGIIVGRKGNVGSVFWAFKDFYPIDTVYYLSTDLNKLFVYFYFQFQSFVSSDCAVPGLNRNYVYNLPMLIPPKSLIDKFGKLVEPIYNQIEKLEMQNQKLREARDILLPRLMNGSIKV